MVLFGCRCVATVHRDGKPLGGDVMNAFIVSRCLVAFVLVSLLSNQSSAKGGGFRSEDPYNPQHIESLPPEVRREVIQRCHTPQALHYFATYRENLQKVVLHFEHFYCGTGETFCGPSGCLHQIYVSSRGHYRLLRSYYAPAGD
jgi:hypothetical protein